MIGTINDPTNVSLHRRVLTVACLPLTWSLLTDDALFAQITYKLALIMIELF